VFLIFISLSIASVWTVLVARSTMQHIIAVVYENGDKKIHLILISVLMTKKQNFEVGHPIVFLANDYANISRHNYV